MLVSCRSDLFCLGCTTDRTGVSLNSFFGAGIGFSHFACIPCVFRGLGDCLAIGKLLSTVFAIHISCIALCLAGCFLFVTDLCMLVSGRRKDFLFFDSAGLADRKNIAVCCTGWLLPVFYFIIVCFLGNHFTRR